MPGAFDLHRGGFPGIAASAINPQQALGISTGGERQFVPLATTNVRPFGISLATAAQGEAITILDEGNVTRVTAIASIGRNAEIGVASTNGALGLVAGASGSVIHSVGQSMTAAASGEEFSVYVNPRQLSGLV